MIRAAAVSGRFYPSDPERLRRQIRALLQASATAPVDSGAVRAFIVPHAGYVYSGPIAATAYACLTGPRIEPIRRVILLGTAHGRTGDRPSASSAEGFETPLGIVPVDRSAVDRVVSAGLATVDDRAHCGDHAIEVQLPFLRMTVGAVPIVPFLVGRVDRSRVVDLLRALTGDAPEESWIGVSSDLSHYRDWATARRLDRATARAIVDRDADRIGPEQACGRDAIAGLLDWAREQGWRAEVLDLRNSGDTAGSRERVVGYGAFLFRDGESPPAQ